MVYSRTFALPALLIGCPLKLVHRLVTSKDLRAPIETVFSQVQRANLSRSPFGENLRAL